MSDDEINDLQCQLHFLAERLRGGNPTKARSTEIMPEGAPGKTPTWIDLLFRAAGTAHYMRFDATPLLLLSGPAEITSAMVGEAEALLSRILLARQLDKVKELHCEYVSEQPFAPDPTLLNLMAMEERKIDQLKAEGAQDHPVASTVYQGDAAGQIEAAKPANAATPAVVDMAAEPAGEPLAEGRLSAGELARCYGVDTEAARKALDRWRQQHAGGDGYIENANPRPNEPRFLYALGAVAPVMEGVKRRASRREMRRTKTSGQRPAKRIFDANPAEK